MISRMTANALQNPCTGFKKSYQTDAIIGVSTPDHIRSAPEALRSHKSLILRLFPAITA
jgi:hypothetical protein